MKLAVLSVPDSWYLKDLRRASSGRHEIAGLSFSELTAITAAARSEIRAGQVGLSEFDAVLVRTMPPGSLEQVVFRMDVLAQLQAAGIPVINAPKALEAAIDKYLSTAKLAAVGLPTPRTLVCQTTDEAMRGWEALGGDVVIKPLFGGEGRGITRVTDVDLALRAFKMLAQLNAVIYLQEFIPHQGFDIRLFVLRGRVLGMRRSNPYDWRTNVSRGANTEPLQVDDQLRHLALAAADAVGASIAGVDILPGLDGRFHVLEVNAVPGWQALSRTLDLDIAALVLDEIEAVVRESADTRVTGG